MSRRLMEALAFAPKTPGFEAMLLRAGHYAEAQGHRHVTLEHLLFALTEDAEAAHLLEACRVDLTALRTEVASHLDRFDDRDLTGTTVDPPARPELIRAIQHASTVAAARARPISSAGMLAAIVGDTETAAAHLLAMQGFSFEAAVGAMQKASQHTDAASPGTHGAGALWPATAAPPLAPAASTPARRPIWPAQPGPANDHVPGASHGYGHGVGHNAGHGQAGGGQPAASYQPVLPSPPVAVPPPPVAATGQVPRTRPPAHPPAQGFRDDRGPHPTVDRSIGRNPQNGRGPAPNATPVPPSRPGVVPPTSGGEHLIGTTPPTQSRRANSLLSETIPRSLRAGETVAVEARLRRADIYALFAGAPAPSGAALHDLRLTHALSARLKAGNGALLIQSQSSETVWLDNRPGVPTDEFVSWRWTMTASKPGRRRVCLSVSARRLGGDGLAAEQNLPDQVVEVRVGRDHKHALIWWGTCIGVFLAGLLIGRLAEPVLRKLSRLLGF